MFNYQVASLMPTYADWRSCSKAHPCPICGRPTPEHPSKWCSMTLDGELACCQFEALGAIRPAGDGWLHSLKPHTPRMRTATASHDGHLPARRRLAQRRCMNWTDLLTYYQRNVDLAALSRLAVDLGVEAPSLSRLGVGMIGPGTFTFPMYDGHQRVIGIHIRQADGSKLAVRGSRNGLFVPHDHATMNGTIVICEGATDTAALLSIGLHAVGRPSCSGGGAYLRTLCDGSRLVVIVADNDKAGRHGALDLADTLKDSRIGPGYIRVVYPPPGIKDARAWVQQGATAAEVLA